MTDDEILFRAYKVLGGVYTTNIGRDTGAVARMAQDALFGAINMGTHTREPHPTLAAAMSRLEESWALAG